jgi:hypothetical protein
MIVKVKHTKNGNVKITMSLEQAQYLRSGLLKAAYGTGFPPVCPMAQEVFLHIDDQLEAAGINF